MKCPIVTFLIEDVIKRQQKHTLHHVNGQRHGRLLTSIYLTEGTVLRVKK